MTHIKVTTKKIKFITQLVLVSTNSLLFGLFLRQGAWFPMSVSLLNVVLAIWLYGVDFKEGENRDGQCEPDFRPDEIGCD